MKIKISKDALNKHLMFLQTGVPAKPIAAVEGWFHFLISKDGSCNIKIANALVEMSTLMKVESEDDCEFCVPAFIMARTVANFPDGDIHMTPNINEDLGVVSIQMKPEGQRKKYKVACTPVGEFTHWPVINDEADVNFKMNMADLHEKLRIAGNNVDSRDMRPQFSNIIFYSHKGKLMVISGNSFLIACLDTNVDFIKSKILPFKLASYTSVLSENGECDFSITNERIRIQFGSYVIIAKTIEGAVPAYNKLFEQEPADNIIVDRVELVSAVKRLSIFSNQENKIVLECKGDSLKVSSQDDNNEAEEFIDVVNSNNVEFRKVVSYPFLQASIEHTKSEQISLADNGGNLFVKPIEGKTKQLWMVAPHAG